MITLSAADIYHITSDLSFLAHSRLEQIYQYDAKNLAFRFHSKEHGRKEIMMRVPQAAYVITKREPVLRQPSFCTFLRKTIKGCILKRIFQPSFNRVIAFEFVYKEKTFFFYAEFFSKGNFILCDSTNNILMVAQVQKWTDRILSPKQKYALPELVHPLKLTKADLEGFILEEGELSKILATKVGLGGFYAREISKNASDSSSILREIKALFSTPKQYSLINERFSILGDACELSPLFESHFVTVTKKTRNVRAEKVNKIIKAQQKSLEKLKQSQIDSALAAKVVTSQAVLIDEIIRKYETGELDSRVVSENKKEKSIIIDVEVNT